MRGDALREIVVPLTYLVSSALFIYGLKRLSRVRTARSGNALAALAMGLAVLGTLVDLDVADPRWIAGGMIAGALIGAFAALRVQMTAMPEMVAILNGLGGAASALVSLAIFGTLVSGAGAHASGAALLGATPAVTSSVSILVGAITFSGSVVAFLKLRGTLAGGRALLIPGRHVLNGALLAGAIASSIAFVTLLEGPGPLTLAVLTSSVLALALGVLLVIPIGGADMPVVVSLLNSYSGVAAAAAGFVIGNPALVIAGAMVGAAGLILTSLMCKAMNRSLGRVLLGGFGQGAGEKGGEYVGVKSLGPDEAAMLLEAAERVIVVPGYGLAVAQAQHAVRELSDELDRRGVKVRYAIHPVAGRMPGHMNVLLAEADIPYEQLFELDAINQDFRTTDVVLVIGANDVVNPAASEDPKSPIFGMPILLAHEARCVLVVKRSLGAGYAGVKNGLFERENASMLFGDAKTIVQATVKALREL